MFNEQKKLKTSLFVVINGEQIKNKEGQSDFPLPYARILNLF